MKYEKPNRCENNNVVVNVGEKLQKLMQVQHRDKRRKATKG